MGKWKSSSFQLLDVMIERASQDGIGMLGKDIATTSKWVNTLQTEF